MATKKTNNDQPKRTDADRRLRQAARLADHLRLLQLLLGRGRWDAKSLAKELEVTERTIYRYLKVLEFAGIPYIYDKDLRCYRVRPDVKFPVLQLSREEVLEQATAATMTKAKGLDVAAEGRSVTHKLAATNAEVAELLADAQNIMAVIDLKLADHSRHHDALKTVQWALIEEKQLAVQYYSPHKESTYDLVLRPYRLCLNGQAWYLIACPGDDQSPRTYRVARMKSVHMLDKEAIIPTDFDLDDYFGNAWNVFRGDTEYKVEIEFSPEAAELVAETVWHKTQKVKRHKDGSATLTFTVDGLDEIVWWVLGWSGRARVVHPVELRDKVVERLHQAIAQNTE